MAALSLPELRLYLQQKAPFVGDRERCFGYPLGALTELRDRRGESAFAQAAKAMALAAQGKRPVAWADGQGELYPPALAQLGMPLERLLWVRNVGEDAAEAAYALVESGCFQMVVLSGMPRALRARETQRLKAAAARGQSILLVTTPS